MDLTFIFSPCPFPDLSRHDNRRFEKKNNKQINKQKQWFLSSEPFDIRIITQKSNFSL